MFATLLAGFGVTVTLSAMAMVALSPRPGTAATDHPQLLLAVGVALAFAGVITALLQREERLRRSAQPPGMWSPPSRR